MKSASDKPFAIGRPDRSRHENAKSVSLELQSRSGIRVGAGCDTDCAIRIIRSSRSSKSDSSSSGGAAGYITSSVDGGDSAYVVDDDRNPLPSEVDKTLLCLAALALVLAANIASVATVHDRTPHKQTAANESYPPLRDIGFDVAAAAGVNENASALLTAAEAIVVATTACIVGTLLCHAHSSIVLRRFFFLLAVMFGLRLLAMNVTMLPVSSTRLYQCEIENASPTLSAMATSFLRVLSVAGVRWSGSDSGSNTVALCGNYIYNSHTVALVMNCLMADEYCPMASVFGVATRLLALIGVLLVIASEYDYTISIITAYYLTTRIFWIYHTMACNASLKERTATNQIGKEWWFPIFRYLEGNVRTVVPRRYDRFF